MKNLIAKFIITAVFFLKNFYFIIFLQYHGTDPSWNKSN